MTNNENLDPGHWIGIMLIILALLCLCATRSCAQTKQTTRIDTVECHNGCIVKFNMATTAKGNPKYSAVYNCTHNGVSDIIPVPKTVYEYIILCRENGIEPSLAIKLKNGIISGIIKYKPKYRIKR